MAHRGSGCASPWLLGPRQPQLRLLPGELCSGARPLSPAPEPPQGNKSRGAVAAESHSGGQSSAPAAQCSPKQLKIVPASWAPLVRSQARGAVLGRQPGIQLSLRAAGGKGKAGSKCLGTNLAWLSLSPAETCSEKKEDGKAFPV